MTDPQEKETVKAELSRRYYEHYLRLAQETGGLQTGQASPDQGAEVASGQGAAPEDLVPSANGEDGTDDAMGSDLQAVQPIDLPSPPPPPADQPRQSSGPPPAAKAKRCFIATAAYESPCAPEVAILQQFRDRCLAGRPWGEWALGWYYRLSPSVAATLDRRPWLRPLVRLALAPGIWWLRRGSAR